MNGFTNKADIPYLEKTKDLIDQNIDLMTNYRQSGHPGGSRSKVQAFLTLLLGGSMRWDIRNPHKKFNDRFILGAGHTIPLIYAAFAVLNEAMRLKYQQTGDSRYKISHENEWALYWEDLTGFRRKGGLSGHAEMQGKTLFLKFNTGPSGHGSAAAAGAALALKRAGADGVKVFLMEGEGGLTPGVTHEVANSAWGLELDNLYFLVDWNDFGIDNSPTSSKVYGTPEDWFIPHGWDVTGTEYGEDFTSLQSGLIELSERENQDKKPGAFWFKTRKGRGYLKYDNSSHGVPHSLNSSLFWETKKDFSEKYAAVFSNYGGKAPEDETALKKEFHDNLKVIADVLKADQGLVDYLSERLVEIAEMVPDKIEGFQINDSKNPFHDKKIYDFRNYPEELYLKPGEKGANKSALGKWGAWINSFGHRNYNRPLFIASSADLAGSTSISGFADGTDGFEGYGWYGRSGSQKGTLLTQEITEFANAGIMAGLASVNMSDSPEADFNGFWGITSTYGSFSYLAYGMMRLFSQMDQDCDLQLGKAIFVAGHSGPETADDSRTHFGIFSPAVTQLFPEGNIINLHPWEYNEVPVLLAAALMLKKPSLIALHLTRPSIEIPDRKALGMASHFDAARGAYIVRDYIAGRPEQGTFFIQGTSAMANTIKTLPLIDKADLNIKLVYVASPQLFALQDDEYRNSIVSDRDRMNSTTITTCGRKLLPEFSFNYLCAEYAISPDWDNRWRTGGTLDEIMEEAHLSPEQILEGIRKFTDHKKLRVERLKKGISGEE